MIPLLESLPDCIIVGSNEYPVFTDWQDWMRFELMLLDPKMPAEEKLEEMLLWYSEEMPENPEVAISSLSWFYRCGRKEDQEKGEGKPKQNQIYDFDEDAETMFASFYDAYRINLARTKPGQLHWWEFRALLFNLPEGTVMAEKMKWRASDEKSLTKEQRKIKKLFELKSVASKRPKTKAERDAELIRHAQEARARAEKNRLSKM